MKNSTPNASDSHAELEEKQKMLKKLSLRLKSQSQQKAETAQKELEEAKNVSEIVKKYEKTLKDMAEKEAAK